MIVFFEASLQGQKDVVELLINNNANVNHKDNQGWNALMKGEKWIIYFYILYNILFFDECLFSILVWPQRLC